MKFKSKNYRMVLGALALGLVVSTMPVAFADNSSQVAEFKKTFSNVPPVELSAKAANLVAQAKAKEQKSIAIAVVRAAVEINPAAAPFVVSAVARAVPAVAPVAAATAVALEPKQAGPIAKAAAAAAPSQAGEIVFAIARDLPGSYAIVAIGASEGAPGATADILAAIARAIPSLKPFIAQASTASLPRSDYASAIITPVILQAQTLVAASAPLQLTSVSGASSALQAVQGPPPNGHGNIFEPGTQGNGDPQRKQTVLVQPGEGRVYSGP